MLNTLVSPINLDSDEFHGTMRRAKDELDKNCWSSPDGSGFMIRGKTYLKDGMKVDSLLQGQLLVVFSFSWLFYLIHTRSIIMAVSFFKCFVLP